MEKERLEEAKTLFLERKQKAKELAFIDNKIEVLLFNRQENQKRKKAMMSGKDWERVFRGNI